MKRQRELATWVGAILGSLCALLFAVAQSHAAENRGQFTQEFHQTYALAAGGRVALANINGSVHISGWDRNEVQITAVKRAVSGEILERLRVHVTAYDDGRLAIDTRVKLEQGPTARSRPTRPPSR